MNRFENITKPLMWFMALLLTAFIAGCGGGGSATPASPSTSTSADKSINTFSIAWGAGTPGNAIGTIDQTLKTIKMTVPHATPLNAMKATFTASAGVSVTVDTVLQVSGSTQNDYTLPVSYKVTAADGTWATYTVLVSRDQTVTSLSVSPAIVASVPVGATQQFVAEATYLDASIDDVTTTADWTADASGNATVGPATGLAVGVTANAIPVVITAAFGGQTDTASMTVTSAALLSIAVSPATGATTPVGGTQQFVATGTYTDGTTPVVTTTANWTSGAGASIGLSTGLATGEIENAIPVAITATIGSIVSNTAELTVTAPPGPNLRRTASFAVLSTGSSITATGTTAVTGDVGATSFTGGGTLNITAGTNYSAGSGQPFVDAVADLPSVISDANDAVLFPCGTSIAPNLSGVALTPGVTCINANAAILNTGVVTLNGAGVYIIRTTGALTPAASSSVAFGGTATNANTTVFWVVGSANIGSPSTWMGTILTGGAVILGDTDTLVKGRVLTTAAITLSNNSIEKP